MADKTYDPSEVVLVVGGIILNSWDSISVSKDEEKWTFSVGTLGESTKTKNLSRMHTISITLAQASLDNLSLNSFLIAGLDIPVSVIDKNGNSLHIMSKGTVVKPADATYEKESSQREWQIKGDVDISVVGGNN